MEAGVAICNFVWRNGAAAEEALTQVNDELYLRTWALQHFLNAIMPVHGTGAGLPNNASFSVPAELLRSVLSLGYNRGAETQRGPQSVPRPPSAMCSPTATARSHSPRYSYTQGRASQKPEHELHGGGSVVCTMWW